MKKRVTAWICTVALLLAMLPSFALAAEPDLTLDLEVTATAGQSDTPRVLSELRAGDIVTANVKVPANIGISSALVKLLFDKNTFEIQSWDKITTGLEEPAYADKKPNMPAGWANMEVTGYSDANTFGYVTATAVGSHFDGTQGKKVIADVEHDTVWTVLSVEFKVKDSAPVGNVTQAFSIASSAKDLEFAHEVSGKSEKYVVAVSDDISATVVQELGSVALNGSVTTPTKGGTDSSNLTGGNVATNVTWSPALTDGKFAANTAYTATVTVTPNTGYVFTDSSNVTMDGYTFTRSGNSFVATKTFETTANKSLTGLTVTNQPTKKDYTHGDQFDHTGMVVKATYDDGSTDTNFTDYTVSYANNSSYLKKGDTAVTVKAGDQTATVSGLTVDQKELSISGLQATNRAYNGATTVAITGGELTGVVDSETVSVTMPTKGNMADANVGNNKSVTVAKPELTGTDAGNYTLADISGVKVNITPAEYTYTYGKTADTATIGTALPTSSTVSATGVNSETVSGTLAWYTDADCTNATSGNFTATGSKTLYWKFTPDSSATNYVATAKTGNVVYTVNALPTQNVTFADTNATVTKTYGDADFTNAATNHTTNSVAISYASSNSNVAVVDNAGQVTIKGAGTTTITATAAEVPAQYAKTEVSYTLTVNKKTVGLTWDGADTRTYDGQLSNVTATATGLISGDEVNVSVTGGKEKDAGTYTATATALTGERAGNYILPNEKTQSYTINKATLEVSSVILKEKTYNGNTDAEVESVSFTRGSGSMGSGGNQPLYTATAQYDTADASDNAPATVQVALVPGGRLDKNYNLTNGENFKTTGKINKAQTTLTVAAKDAVYTGVAYAEKNLTKTSNLDTAPTYTYYTDNNGAKGTALETAPVNAGTYWVEGSFAETTNYSAVTSEAVKFQITKAPLTIKANAKTITYGEAATNDGVTYEGLAGSDTSSVVTGLTYEYNYERYGNVGDYTITPKGATADNYDITYLSGKLTVNKKTVGLTWSNTESLYYNGEAKNVTATATELVNNDTISVTVVGGKETAVGNYTAKATALTGDKAGNYALPTDVTNVTKNYQIQAALSASDLTIDPTTVTATIDGLTIKLVGYKNASGTVTVSKGKDTAADNKLTVNGVTYTIDDSAVKVIDTAKIEIKTPTCTVKVPDELAAALTGFAATSDGLNNAMADLIAKAAEGMPENAKKVEVTVVLEICPTAYADGKLRLSIEPKIKYEYKDEQGATISTKEEAVKNSDIKSLITIGVKVPNGFTPNFAKHYLSGSTYEMLPVTIDSNGYATWQQSSFSEVELVNDTRTATVNFTFEDGHSQSVTYGPADLGKAFPTDSKDGYTFNGWTIGDKTYTTLTEEALTELSKGASTLNATPAFTQNSSSGGNHGGNSGGGVSGYAVSVTTPKNGKVSVDPRNAAKGAAVTVTVTPDSGYEMDKLTVTDASGKTIPTTDKGNGKFTFTMPNGKVSVSATFKQTTVTPPSTGFVDVPASAYYADAVKWAVEKGITTGTSATTFSPEASCTRAQMVTFLWRAAGSPAPKATTTAFTDLDKSAYYYDAVLWAVEQGITTGTSATTFSPNATVTRGQTVTFLYRFAGQPAVSGSSFTDVNSSDYYAAAVQWAKEQGITSGTSDTTFSPTNDCTRGQIVTFLYRQLAK